MALGGETGQLRIKYSRVLILTLLVLHPSAPLSATEVLWQCLLQWSGAWMAMFLR